MTTQRILGALLIVLGVSAVAIGASIYFLGATMTARAAESLSGILSGSHHAATAPFDATTESELHFYAPFWFVYGIVLTMTARNLGRHLNRVPLLAAIFFAGGVGRAIAFVQAGPPHPAFTALMVTELVLPLVFVALWARARRPRSQ